MRSRSSLLRAVSICFTVERSSSSGVCNCLTGSTGFCLTSDGCSIDDGLCPRDRPRKRMNSGNLDRYSLSIRDGPSLSTLRPRSVILKCALLVASRSPAWTRKPLAQCTRFANVVCFPLGRSC